MEPERRNDIGTKVLIAVVTLLTVTIMGFSINTASVALATANANSVEIGIIKANQSFIKENLTEIKIDVKEVISIVKQYEGK